VKWFERSVLSLTLVICLLLTSSGCSSVLPSKEMQPAVEIEVEGGWETCPKGCHTVLPTKDLRKILRNRLRWIIWGKVLAGEAPPELPKEKPPAELKSGEF